MGPTEGGCNAEVAEFCEESTASHHGTIVGVKEPDLITACVLADEPTGNLDTRSADDVFTLMRKFNQETGIAFLLVTHDPRIAARCDRTIELIDGRIVSQTI